MFVELSELVVEPQRDSRDGKPAENMLRSRRSDRNRRFPAGRVQQASSRMPFALQNPYAT